MANLKLNQVIAIEKGAKANGERALTNAYHQAQKPGPWNGVTRTYQPKDDDGDRLPPESTRVQFKGEALLDSVARELTRLFDVTATKDEGNTHARADVVVDGQVILAQVPVPTLLYLEKKLVDLTTFLSKLPVLDPADVWTWDQNRGIFQSEAVQTTRTKKIPRNHVKAEATDKHPAQVEVYTEDVQVGTWTTIKLSGAFAETRLQQLEKRARSLTQAVKEAREAANSIEVQDVHIGEAVFSYLLVR